MANKKPIYDTVFGGVSLKPGGWETLRLHFFLPRRERQRWWQDRETPRTVAVPHYYCESCSLSFTSRRYQPERCVYCAAPPGHRRIVCYEGSKVITTFPFYVNAQRLALVNWQIETIQKEAKQCPLTNY